MPKQKQSNLKIAIVSLIIVLLVNFGGITFAYGRAMERLDNLCVKVDQLKSMVEQHIMGVSWR